MDVLSRITVMPGNVAALETPIHYMAVGRVSGTNRCQLSLQLWIATGAIESAEVEVRQLAVEQVRDHRADRMRVEQQGVAELGLQSRQLVVQGAVIRRPDLFQIGRPLRRRRLHALLK